MLESSFDKSLISKYGGAVPRYTSYPAAPHFRHVPPKSYVSYLLSSLPQNVPLSLYFHIPFCRQLCHYCGCFTKVINHDAPMQSYLSLLIREIDLAGRIIGFKAPVDHIHFGGGTPNILTPADVETLMEAVGRNFSLLDRAEIAMEIDPRQMSADKADGYAALGLNRVSLGVQTFQEDVQRAVNRVQPYDMIAHCMEGLQKAGIRNINFDLMYGLPLQTVKGIKDTVDKAADLSPGRIALFGYAHVPWMRHHQKLMEKFAFPDTLERFAQQAAAREKLNEKGYADIGMDHFARPDDALFRARQEKTLRRNFQGYTTDNAAAIIGFGLSSISSFPEAYIQNTTDIKTYRDNLDQDTLPAAKGCILTKDDKMRSSIIQALMCYFEADIAQICRNHQMKLDDLKDCFDALYVLQADGLVEIDGSYVKVTPKGRIFVRVICKCFDAYHQEEKESPRHAKAV